MRNYFMYAVLCVWLTMTAAAQEELWTMRLPENGIVPSYAKATWLARMGERHGSSHLGLQEYTANLPLMDGRRSHLGRWGIDIQGNVTATFMDVCGTPDLERDDLYVFSLPITFTRATDGCGERHMMFTVIPRYAGDSDCAAHAWDLSLVAAHRVRRSDTFTYSVGVAVSPRFAEYAAVPYFSFSWQASPNFLLRLHGYRLAALCKVTDRLNIGPAVACEGGSWMVSTPKGRRIFRVRSLTASFLAEYDLSSSRASKRILSAAVGTTLATTAEFCHRNARRKTIAMQHYHPGLVVSLGMDFRF